MENNKMYFEVSKEKQEEVKKLLVENGIESKRQSIPLTFMVKPYIDKYLELNRDYIREEDAVDFVVDSMEKELYALIRTITRANIKYELSKKDNKEE